MTGVAASHPGEFTAGTDRRPAERARAFHVVTAVWGASYLELFLDVCLPNQLSAGNLDALPPGSRYRIFTRAEDVLGLEGNAVLRRVAEGIPVDIVPVAQLSVAETLPADDRRSKSRRYDHLTACHQRAIADANAAGVALVFLSADVFLSTGTLAALVRRHASGARAVVVTGLRMAKESFVAALDELGGARSLAPRALVRLALQHLHPYTLDHFVDASPFSKFPTAINWRVGQDGILVRAFHLHPLLVDPEHREILPRETIDGHYLALCCPRVEDVHIVKDSDEMVAFEMSPVDRQVVGASASGWPVWRAATVASRSDSLHLRYLTEPIRLHAGPLDASWCEAERASAAFVARVLLINRFALLLSVYRRVDQVMRRSEKYWKPWRRRYAHARRYATKSLPRAVTLTVHDWSRRIQKAQKRRARAGRRRSSVAD